MIRTAMLAGASLATFAAGTAQAAEAESENKGGLEEITVTARKRVEDVQSVPIAVTGMSSESIENRFVADIRQVAKYIPNVQLGQVQFSGATLSASIRGLTFADIERSFEPAVATSIDDIFLASNTGALVDMFDMESIEVLRGPHGARRRAVPSGALPARRSVQPGAAHRHQFRWHVQPCRRSLLLRVEL